MTWRAVFITSVAVLLLGTGSPASADFDVVYPTGDEGFEFNLGFGQHLAAFWNLAFDKDLFVFQADAVSDPLPTSVFGSSFELAFWFQFIGFDAFGRHVFNVFGTQDLNSFFFVEQVVF
jgi:hypothetical protein